MKVPKYARVLIAGTEGQLNAYLERSGQCVVVDWRGEEEPIIEEVARLSGRKLAWEWIDAEDDLYILEAGRRHKVGLTMSGRDRYITLRKLNEVLTGRYEIRAFRHTLGDDTHCLYVKPCAWWAAMEEHFPAAIKRVFAKITRRTDFPDYR